METTCVAAWGQSYPDHPGGYRAPPRPGQACVRAEGRAMAVLRIPIGVALSPTGPRLPLVWPP